MEKWIACPWILVCINIPANSPDTPIPLRAKVKVYEAQEKYGWVWLFMGEAPESERIPIPELPNFDDAKLWTLDKIEAKKDRD